MIIISMDLDDEQYVQSLNIYSTLDNPKSKTT